MTKAQRKDMTAELLETNLSKPDVVERGDVYSRNTDDELAGYMRLLSSYPSFRNQASQVPLFRWYKEGTGKKKQEARDLLVYGNMKLVRAIARQHKWGGLDMLDLMQEGVFGLMTAIEKYDISLGFNFSTYATNWIRQSMKRAIADYGGRRPFRMPVHVEEKIGVVARTKKQLVASLQREPNELEVYEAIKKLDTKIAEDMRLDQVVDCVAALAIRSQSMNSPIGYGRDGEEGSDFGDILPDPYPRTETVIEARRLLKEYRGALAAIEATLGKLGPRNAMVIRLRFGLGEFEAQTLEEVGERYGLTRERIRQIEVKGLEELETHLGVKPADIAEIVRVTDELAKLAAM